MMLTEKTVKDFLADTASSSPAPGGGSVSALAGALGTALAEMVINLTVGKKKYVEVAAELSELLPELAGIRAQLNAAVDEDTAAFNEVMAAFALPRQSDEEKRARRAAITEATLKATRVPLSVMEAALRALEITRTVAEKGNVNSASDAGVAGLMLAGAIEGAALNVRINLGGLSGHPFAEEAARKLAAIELRKAEISAAISAAVAANIAA